MNSLRYHITCFLLLISYYSFSQFYNTGTAPFRTKYRVINTENYRLIYPAESESLAQRYASTLTHIYPGVSHSLNHKPSKIDIIMHNQNVRSNGYVVWAPKRMEIVTTSPQRQYAHDWLEQLALHEYRHVVQVDKLNQGFTKGLSYVFGEMGTGAMMSFLPLWYLEGDAVVTETALSNTGRGRDPNFIQHTRAAEMQREKRFKYDEFYLGTYKDYAPNHYYFGYNMVAWSRMQYGEDVWSKVINNVGRRPYTIAPFYFGLKSETGESKVSLYENSMDYLNLKWKQEDSVLAQSLTPFQPVKGTYKSNYVSYQFPYQTSSGSVLALRTSIDDIAKIVEIKDGTEKVIQRLGYFQGSRVSYSEKYIAWEEVHPDPRWEQKSHSVIRIYNRDTKTSSLLNKPDRHFAPDISPASDKICVKKNDGLYNAFLEIWDIEKKLLIKRYQAKKNTKLFFPTWLDENRIAVITLTEKGKGISVLNLETKEWTESLAPGFENISYLEGKGNDLYFSYTHDGRVNIYNLDIKTGELNRVTNDKIGANFASLSSKNKEMLYSGYSANGFKIKKIKLNKENWTPISEIKKYTFHLAESNADQEIMNIQDSLIVNKKYESKKYRKGFQLFNVHSWLVPFYLNLDELPDAPVQVYPGISLFSQNSLSSMTSSLSYYYKNGYHYLRPGVSLRLFYPVLDMEYQLGGPTQLNTQLAKPDPVPNGLQSYAELITTLSVPFSFSTSRYTFSMQPSVRHRYSNGYIADSTDQGNATLFENSIYYYKGYATLDYRFNLYMASKMAYKALRPKWGFRYYVSHQSPQLHSHYWSSSTVQFITAYLPGLFRHQSLQVQLGLEIGFGTRMSPARGYTSSDVFLQFQEFLFASDEAQKVSVDYAFPILYPNLSVGSLAYFKRIHANVFFDYCNYSRQLDLGNQKLNLNNNFSSIGADIGFETNFLRFFWTFVPTLRYSYRIEDGGSSVGFFMTTQFGFAIGDN